MAFKNENTIVNVRVEKKSNAINNKYDHKINSSSLDGPNDQHRKTNNFMFSDGLNKG